ncbi:MAG: site-specific DNA-methyltransferase [Thermoplasmata archaeon]
MTRARLVARIRLPTPGGGSVALWCGDGVEGIRRRGPYDAIVTSPPYNLRQPYRTYRDRRPREEYLDWIGSFADAAASALAPDGSLFLNVGSVPRDPWLAWDVARRVGERLVLQNVLHWVKSIAIDRALVGRESGVGRDLALGHYRPVASRRYVHGAHEYVFHFTRTGRVPIDRLALGVPYQDASNRRRWRGGGLGRRCRGNVWFLPYATIQGRATDRPHPATFPPELPAWCLRLHGLGRVRRWADPFVGIGASAVAASRLGGAAFDGFDIDPVYLAVALARVRRLVAEGADGAAGLRPTAPSAPDRSRAAGSTAGSGASGRLRPGRGGSGCRSSRSVRRR